MKNTKHGTFQVSTAFHEAVETYRQQQGLRSWSAAFIALASIGYRAETGKEPPKASEGWGGVRRGETVES